METVSGVHLWLILIKAFHSIGEYSARTMRGSGLGESDFRVLEVLLHKGPMAVNTVGPKVALTSGSISVAVDRLHAKGLVSRCGGEADRRVRVVALTAKGRTLIKRVFGAHAKEMDDLAKVLEPSERVHLADLLKKLGKHAEAFNRSQE